MEAELARRPQRQMRCGDSIIDPSPEHTIAISNLSLMGVVLSETSHDFCAAGNEFLLLCCEGRRRRS